MLFFQNSSVLLKTFLSLSGFFLQKKKSFLLQFKKRWRRTNSILLGENLNILLMLLTKTYLLSKFWKIHAFQSFCLQKRLTTLFNKISPNDTSSSGNFWGSCLVVNFFLLHPFVVFLSKEKALVFFYRKREKAKVLPQTEMAIELLLLTVELWLFFFSLLYQTTTPFFLVKKKKERKS